MSSKSNNQAQRPTKLVSRMRLSTYDEHKDMVGNSLVMAGIGFLQTIKECKELCREVIKGDIS